MTKIQVLLARAELAGRNYAAVCRKAGFESTADVGTAHRSSYPKIEEAYAEKVAADLACHDWFNQQSRSVPSVKGLPT